MDHIARAADALAAAYLEVIELPADTLGLIFAVFDQGDYPYDFVQPPVAIPRCTHSCMTAQMRSSPARTAA